jgi:ADP-heptose:LPS heptosyltransferase
VKHPTQPPHLLVFRFSSMGDVAMTVPVVTQLLKNYPSLTITFVSDQKFSALFHNIAGLQFYPVDMREKYHGFLGLLRLFIHLKKIKNVTAIADLHDVLRTKVLTFLFSITGIKVRRIDKGRKGKKALTRKFNKTLVQLPTSFQRYADVFARLGYAFTLANSAERIRLPANTVVKELLSNNNTAVIGIAPFAKHREKTYPVEKMEKVIAALLNKKFKILLFGGGEEMSLFEAWKNKFNNVQSIAGKLSFEEELVLISHLDMMISMDSANMHLASLYGVPVVSIWGATHPFAGFYGFAQDDKNAVQADLYCRPCSVFGNKPCYRGDWACMELIAPNHIIHKVENILQR